MEKSEWIWMNGDLVRWDDAKVHVLSHGLHYGTGVFEGIRVYRGPAGLAVFRLREHVQRLFDSAKLYKIPMPPSPSSRCSRPAARSSAANGLDECYLRPIAAYLGHGPLACTLKTCPPTWSWRRLPRGAGTSARSPRSSAASRPRSRPAGGCTTPAFPTTAKGSGRVREQRRWPCANPAKEKGFEEAILLDAEGRRVRGQR